MGGRLTTEITDYTVSLHSRYRLYSQLVKIIQVQNSSWYRLCRYFTAAVKIILVQVQYIIMDRLYRYSTSSGTGTLYTGTVQQLVKIIQVKNWSVLVAHDCNPAIGGQE